MDAETRHELLVVNPAPRQPHPAPSVPAAVLAWAARQPNAVAVIDGERQLSHGELAAASAGLAARLVEAGVGPEDAVAIVAERSLEAVVAQLAVLRAGGYYVPLCRICRDVRLRLHPRRSGVPSRLSAVPPSFECAAQWGVESGALRSLFSPAPTFEEIRAGVGKGREGGGGRVQ